MEERPTIFISYSDADAAWKNRLTAQLGVLARQGLLDVWDDQRISAGADWRNRIHDAISAASVAIFLISADFLDS
jgi:hypothetical protein